jgi:hypothetical protein
MMTTNKTATTLTRGRRENKSGLIQGASNMEHRKRLGKAMTHRAL